MHFKATVNRKSWNLQIKLWRTLSWLSSLYCLHLCRLYTVSDAFTILCKVLCQHFHDIIISQISTFNDSRPNNNKKICSATHRKHIRPQNWNTAVRTWRKSDYSLWSYGQMISVIRVLDLDLDLWPWNFPCHALDLQLMGDYLCG